MSVVRTVVAPPARVVAWCRGRPHPRLTPASRLFAVGERTGWSVDETLASGGRDAVSYRVGRRAGHACEDQPSF
jgi:hypothetical protein